MRLALLTLVVFALLFLPLRTAQAEDEERVDRLEGRVEALVAMVSDLRLEVARLRAHVAQLEAEILEMQTGRGIDVVTVHPEDPEDQVDAVDGEVVIVVPALEGRWTLDREAFMKIMIERMTSGQDENITPELLEILTSTMSEFVVELVLREDGTFVVEATGMGNDESRARGTWSQDGRTVLLKTTHEDGVEKEVPDEMIGDWVDGTLRLHPEGEDEFVLPLVRPE